jgi:PAS domain S-box-containing protein
MTINKNNFKNADELHNMSKDELKKIQKSLKDEIDYVFNSLSDFEIKSNKISILPKEIEQDKIRLIDILGNLENKINNFFLTIHKQEIIDDLGQNAFKIKSSMTGMNDIVSLSEHFTNLRQTLKQNQLFDKVQHEELEKRLQESNDLKKALDESSIIVIMDKQGTIVYVNKLFEEISEYGRNESIEQHLSLLKSDYHTEEFFNHMWKTISNGFVWKGDIKNKTKSGKFYWVKTTIVPLLGKNDQPEQYFVISTDVTKQKELEIKLSDALEEIKKTDELKNEFASMITHELKTPLTPIRGYCEILKDESFGVLNNDQKDFVNTIEQNATRLERLIGDVLDVQKLDMGKMTFTKKNLDVDEFLKNIEKDLAPLLKEKEIYFSVPDNVKINIYTDKFRLQEIFENLIRNSIDFVPHKGKIDIIVQNNEKTVIFSVGDNGVGIPREKQSNIFKKFFQGDTSQTRKHGGTGLGLVVCKGLIEGLGGKIWFNSQEGLGTTFYFSMPK